MNFHFDTDAESRTFCESIACGMSEKYGISVDEAVRRINRLWVGTDFIGEEDLIYHRPESYWIDHIYGFYEERVRNGTADLPKEVLIEKKRQLWEQWQRSGNQM